MSDKDLETYIKKYLNCKTQHAREIMYLTKCSENFDKCEENRRSTKNAFFECQAKLSKLDERVKKLERENRHLKTQSSLANFVKMKNLVSKSIN